MNISSTAAPYLLSIERSDKPKATYGNRFRVELKNQMKKNQLNESAEEQAVAEIQKSVKEKAIEPSYSVTEEEINYFREKYGDKYSEEEVFKLFNELVEKNIISDEDANAASRKSIIERVEFTGYVPDNWQNNINLVNSLLASGRMKLVAHCEKIDYGNTYNEYSKNKSKSINTWTDYVQDNYNYYQYLMENYTEIQNFDGEPYITNVGEVFGKYCECSEKVQKVLAQIFG